MANRLSAGGAPSPALTTTSATGRSPHLLVGHADDRHLGDAGDAQDDVLEVERRHPLAAGLHDVLDAVDDLQIAVSVDDADVAGVQPAAAPQLLGALGLAEVALREPRRAHDDLALARAVVRDVVHVRVDDAQLHERNRPSGPASVRQASLGVPVAHLRQRDARA